MFEAERERCYEGIRKCDAFLKDYATYEEIYGTRKTADRVLPEKALSDFSLSYRGHGAGAVIFHLKAKMQFIRLLADMQEAENALYVD